MLMMTPYCGLKNKWKSVILSFLIFFTLCFTQSLGSSVEAQWFPAVPRLGFPLLGNQAYFPGPQIPTYSFFTPWNNNQNLVPRTANSYRSSASAFGSLSPLPPSPVARIAGATTIFIPPTVPILSKVVIKPSGLSSIKLSNVAFPLTVYIYPTGYVPPAPTPVITPTTIAPAITTAPATISPTASAPAAAVSGLLYPFSNRFPSGIRTSLPFFGPIY